MKARLREYLVLVALLVDYPEQLKIVENKCSLMQSKS